MNRLYTTTLLLLFCATTMFAQKLETFTPEKFLSELEPFMTASGNKRMKDTYNGFAKKYKKDNFTPEQQTRIVETANKMLQKKMTANPYFVEYLQGLMIIDKGETGQDRFTQWHGLLDELIISIQDRQLKPFLNFLKFSTPFYQSNALRETSRGVSWYGISDKPNVKLENGIAVIEYDELDLIAVRKNDTISIERTKGVFNTKDGSWKGIGGKVTWVRFGLEDVYAELKDYEIDVKSALYKVKEATIYYPFFFGTKGIEGSFEDKIVSENASVDGSYPRFVSKNDIIKIDKIGEGIEYQGGFRLEGTTVYGYGSKERPAFLSINDKNTSKRLFNGYSELFTIRSGEKIVSQRTRATLYFDQDSMYHPSADVRFDILEHTLQMKRGTKGSDRNPFYSSMHSMNIETDKIKYYIGSDSIVIGEKDKMLNRRVEPAIFESTQFFNENDYHRFQNISTTNPIAVMRAVAEREGNILSAHDLAKKLNSRYSVENIKSLLYDLVSKGFINYDPDTEMVEIKEKIYHYANSSVKKTDYDALQVISESEENNGSFNLKNKVLQINDVKSVIFSDIQKTAAKPFKKKIFLNKNRNMDFDGALFSGFSIYEGKGFHFNYDKFNITMDSVRYLDLYVPTGVMNEETGQEEALSIASRIEHLSGILLIDAPENKSGREELPMFPSLQTKEPSYVYYDKNTAQNKVYTRDSFYFELIPFSFNSLDKFTKADVAFKGKLVSADIFPDIQETIAIREEDQSLGFIHQTPASGLPAYKNAGNFNGKIDLSDGGLLGKGTLNYLQASINSEDLVFRPKNTTGSAERFILDEVRNANPEIPKVRGNDVNVLWKPYSDSLSVTSAEAPFEMFQESQHTLKGTVVLTPKGLKGKGLFDWPKASMTSSTFSFGAYSALADTTDLKIRAFDTNVLALSTDNLNATVDFDKQIGNFKANEDLLTTSLPYNEYETSFNEFDWDIAGEVITFKATEGKTGKFLSVNPDQDSLRYEGKAASYDLKTSTLAISGVEEIISADAFIYPSDGKIEVYKAGKMSKLSNAKIEADTINKYHVINRAEVEILGRKEFRANGYYQYNVGNKEQEIRFDEIVGTRIGKGSRAKKATATRATGEVKSETNFLIDTKTLYRGTVSLFSETPNLKFDGYARLNSATLKRLHWFSVAFDGDKNDLKIKYSVPKNYEAEPIRTGVYLSKETNRVYSNIMAPLYYRKDHALLPVTGIMDYKPKEDAFIFGDSIKVIADNLAGNKLTYFDQTGKIECEGKFNIGDNLRYVSMQSAGEAMVNPSRIVNDTSECVNYDMEGNFMLMIDLLLPDDLKKMLENDFINVSFDLESVNYIEDTPFYQKALANLIGEDDKNAKKILNNLGQGILDIPKKVDDADLLFSRVPMKWDADYQSFVSTGKTLNLGAINGHMMNKKVEAYIEVKMPSRGDDRIYVYLKSPSGLFYFFGFKEGILNIVSDNTKFNDYIIDMKTKERIKKMPDGETFEIQPVNEGTARQFVNRVKATW